MLACNTYFAKRLLTMNPVCRLNMFPVIGSAVRQDRRDEVQ
jgi:hypothetical protein